MLDRVGTSRVLYSGRRRLEAVLLRCKTCVTVVLLPMSQLQHMEAHGHYMFSS